MQTEIDIAIERAEQALALDQIDAACEALGRIMDHGVCPGQAEPVLTKVKTAATDRIKQHLDNGDLGRACRLLNRLIALLAPERPVEQPGIEGHESGEGQDQGLILQIDGVGSFLIFTGPMVSVGPVNSPARPTLGLLADPRLATVKICRCEDDYFVTSGRSGPVQRRLLADADRIDLSDRCKLEFHLPNRASTTAVVQISGGRLPRADLTAILLVDRDILIGPCANHHIRAALLDRVVTLVVREGRLWWTMAEPEAPLDVDRPIRVGPLSLVITAWRPGASSL